MKVNILDLIDFKQIDTLLEGFNKTTGFVTAILDLDGNVLSKSGWRQICTEFHRINPETSKKCTISDTVLAKKLDEGELYHYYECLNGLIDVAVPIVINGKHIANLFSGQFFFEEPDRMFFKEQAERYGFDEKKYLAALDKVPVVSKEKVKTAMDFLLKMTLLISETTFQKLEQMQLHDAVLKSEEKYRGLFTSIRDGIVIVDINRIVVDCNPAFSDLFGYSLQEILGKSAHILYQSKEEYIDFGKTLKRNSGGELFITKVNYKKKTGEQFTGEIAITRMTDIEGKFINYIGLIRDISERVQIDDRLVKSQEQFEIAMEASQDGLYDWNLLTNDIYYSPGWKRMLGYEDQEIANDFSEWEKLTNHTDVEKAIKMQQELINKDCDRFEIEIQMKHKNGHWVDILSRAKATFDNSGKAVRIIGTHVDITELKKLEAELQQSQKMESIGTLAGGIAHDFNNILSSVIGFTELALDAVEKESVIADDLQEVYAAGLRAKDLVQQILTFARQSEETLLPIQIDTIIKEVLKFIRSSIPTTIEIKQDINCNSIIMASSTELHRVMMNLCTNAAQAMESDGGTLEITLKDINFAKTTNIGALSVKPGDYVEVKVSDTGDGINPQVIEKVFEPYFTTKGVGKGTGMGLSMVHGIVETYGGHILVESRLGKGTVFTIYLPVATTSKAHQQHKVEKLPTGQERILFIDDESPITKIAGRVLKQLGYSVTTRTSGIEALEIFRSNPDEFDLVISDVTMPKITGDQLTQKLIAIRPNIPVILCTGYSKNLSMERASEIGIKALVYKPIVKEDLAKTVRRVLDEAED